MTKSINNFSRVLVAMLLCVGFMLTSCEGTDPLGGENTEQVGGENNDKEEIVVDVNNKVIVFR